MLLQFVCFFFKKNSFHNAESTYLFIFFNFSAALFPKGYLTQNLHSCPIATVPLDGVSHPPDAIKDDGKCKRYIWGGGNTALGKADLIWGVLKAPGRELLVL